MLLPTMVDHGWQCFCQPWLTMVDNAFANHGKPWLTMLLPTMGNHGWLRCHFTNLWLTMVDHGLEKLCQTMVNHGWLWFKKALPNHGQPWLTMVDWPTMVNHGQPWSTFNYLFLPFLSEIPMAEPWPAKLRLVQVPSLLVENRYKVSLLTWDSFVQTGVQWLHKGKFLCEAHIFV